MNELGTVMTSSPGPMPRARRASQRASVPLPTPTAWAVRQKKANSSSKRATTGPPAKALLSITSLMAARSSARIGSCWARRSRNGTRIKGGFFADSGRIAGDDGAGGHVLGHDASGSDHGVFTDGYSTEKGGVGADRGAALDEGRDA